MPPTLRNAITRIKLIVRDDSGKLADPGDYYEALAAAFAEYSQTRALRVVQDVDTDANGQIATGDIDDFDEAFVDRLQVEYPVSTSGRVMYLNDNSWALYTTPDGSVLRFASLASASLRLHHFIARSLPVDVEGNPDPDGALPVPASEFTPICWLAAAEALQMLADFYTNTADKSTGADFVSFTTKSREYEQRAKTYKKKYVDYFNKPFVM